MTKDKTALGMYGCMYLPKWPSAYHAASALKKKAPAGNETMAGQGKSWGKQVLPATILNLPIVECGFEYL